MSDTAAIRQTASHAMAHWQSLEAEVGDFLCFWRGAHADWFSQDPAFDRLFRYRYLDLHLSAARGELNHWRNSPDGSLALLILLDQFPRNAFRGTVHMYATDSLARQIANRARKAGFMQAVDAGLRLFFCLPFAHSEDIADQDVSVELNGWLGQPWLSHAEGHRDIIRRFGRFPHRNHVLGRQTTAAEHAFLNGGGFAG